MISRGKFCLQFGDLVQPIKYGQCRQNHTFESHTVVLLGTHIVEILIQKAVILNILVPPKQTLW